MNYFERKKVPAGQCQRASSLRPRGGRSSAKHQRPRQCPHHLFQGWSWRRSPVKGKKTKQNTLLCHWRLNLFAFFWCRSARIQDGRPHLHLPLLLICPVHHIHHHEGHYCRADGRWAHRPVAACSLRVMVGKFTPPLHPVDSGTPSGLKYSEVRDSLVAVKGVTAVHNLHIWALTMNQAVLSAHVAIGENVYFILFKWLFL